MITLVHIYLSLLIYIKNLYHFLFGLLNNLRENFLFFLFDFMFIAINSHLIIRLNCVLILNWEFNQLLFF